MFSMIDRLKYKWACWWLDSPTVQKIGKWIEEKDRKYNESK